MTTDRNAGPPLNLLDVVLLLLIGVSAFTGLRGVIKEVFSLVLIVAAALVSLAWLNDAAPLLDIWISSAFARQALAGLGLFLGMMLIGHLLINMTTHLVRSIGLGGVDRMLGFGFGALRAVALLVIIYTYAGPWLMRTFPALEAEVDDSLLMPMIEIVSEWLQDNFDLRRFVKDPLSEYLP
ncbi:MAG: CvpA family protein [Gammaproteobacteria bacterium AqS3]|nr:CvpA family protein [Gammaproteobacteria bacterium AqS3]